MESSAALGLALLGRRRWRRGPRPLAVARIAAAAYLVLLAVLLAATLLPVLIGWRPFLVRAAGPGAPSGSVVLADRDGTLAVDVGDSVVVRDRVHPGQLLARRVAAVRPDGTLVTVDGAERPGAVVRPGSVVGRVRATVPMLGVVARHGSACALLSLLALLLVSVPRRSPGAGEHRHRAWLAAVRGRALSASRVPARRA